MGSYLSKIQDLVRRAAEKETAGRLVERHWPAVEETLRQEFAGPGLETALKAGKRACERLIEHVV